MKTPLQNIGSFPGTNLPQRVPQELWEIHFLDIHLDDGEVENAVTNFRIHKISEFEPLSDNDLTPKTHMPLTRLDLQFPFLLMVLPVFCEPSRK